MKRISQSKHQLPELTAEQAQQIVDFLNANYDDSNLDWDNYCCTSDVAPDAYGLAVETFARAYGIFKELKCGECGEVQTIGKCTNTECERCDEYEERCSDDE